MKRIEFYVYYIDKNETGSQEHDWLFGIEVHDDLTDDMANKVTNTIEAWEREHPNFEIISDIIFI